ncbi:MAG: tyrosine-type recombinase/integrase [Roseburia intestinalis]
MEEQIARAMIIHQMLGTRISDTLTLRKDCLYKHDRQDMIIIYQPKTRRYEKPISRELAQLIGKAVSYANEHYPESIYIFADENKPERPISYQTLQDKVLRMIYEKDIRDDSGKLFGFGTHMFRHCYGVKLTELHVDDWTIAKLLGHKGVKSVQYYRKMSNQRLADETREVRNLMSQIILANLDGWGEEYEQIRQDAGIE